MAKTVRVSDKLYAKLMASAGERNTSIAAVLDYLVDQGERYLGGFEELKKNLDLCPKCGYILHLHCEERHSHKATFLEDVKEVSVRTTESTKLYHLECIRCGYSIEVRQPEWVLKEPIKTWDVRLEK